MKFYKKVGSVLLAAALTVGMMASCGNTSSLDQTVMTINGEEISNAEYRYYFNSLKSSFDSGDETFWKENKDQVTQLKNLASQYILNAYAVEELAKDEKVELTKEDKKVIDETYQSMVSQYENEKQMEDALNQSNLTPEVFRKVLESNQMSQKLFDHFYGDVVLKEVNDNTYFSAKHILVKFDDEDAETHDEELEAAKKLLKRANNGEDFDTLIKDYGEDPGMTGNPNGYVFDSEGKMRDGGGLVEEFYKATQKLEMDGISDIVETSYGYHIIKRVPLNQEYIAANLSFFASDEMNEEYEAKIAKVQEGLDVKYESVYDKITYNTYTTATKASK